VETYEHVRAPQTSINRYIPLVGSGSSIKQWEKSYEYDPVYELVCQTLLVEGIIKSCDKVLRVDDYLHLNVIPAGNKELRSDVCTFSDGLIDSSKYLIISPEKLMEPVKNTHRDLCEYLAARYWK